MAVAMAVVASSRAVPLPKRLAALRRRPAALRLRSRRLAALRPTTAAALAGCPVNTCASCSPTAAPRPRRAALRNPLAALPNRSAALRNPSAALPSRLAALRPAARAATMVSCTACSTTRVAARAAAKPLAALRLAACPLAAFRPAPLRFPRCPRPGNSRDRSPKRPNGRASSLDARPFFCECGVENNARRALRAAQKSPAPGEKLRANRAKWNNRPWPGRLP
jgi:hypothetical protein